MTDLRTAAQAVLDEYSKHGFMMTGCPSGQIALAKLHQALDAPVESRCNPHPDAPHGFNRNASHTEDRYVCDCESWEPPSVDALIADLMELHLTWEDYQDVKEVCDKYRGQK